MADCTKRSWLLRRPKAFVFKLSRLSPFWTSLGRRVSGTRCVLRMGCPRRQFSTQRCASRVQRNKAQPNMQCIVSYSGMPLLLQGETSLVQGVTAELSPFFALSPSTAQDEDVFVTIRAVLE